MIKAIIFDCFGVLTEDVWVAFCGELEDLEVARRAHELSHQRNRGFLSEDEFVEQVSEVTGKSAESVRDTLRSGLQKNERLLDYIKELRLQGYQTAIVSNIGSDWITSEFLNPEEQKLFDHLVLSYEVGVVKPDPRMYRVAAERFDLPPEQIVFIDDQPAYIEAAREQGMYGITYEHFAQMRQDLEVLLDTDK